MSTTYKGYDIFTFKYKEIFQLCSNFVAGIYAFKEFIGKMDGKFYCRTCGFSEKHSSNLKAHIESKHYSPGYSCPHCGREFKIENTLRRHLKLQKCFATAPPMSPYMN